jgi:hypothetical protein
VYLIFAVIDLLSRATVSVAEDANDASAIGEVNCQYAGTHSARAKAALLG